MSELFRIILYQPIFNLLIWLYNIIPGSDIGLAILGLTLIIKLVLWPFSAQSLKSQRRLQELQPQLREIQKKYKDNKQETAKATMSLYKEAKVNPFSSCLPLLIQFPFLIALYKVLMDGLKAVRPEILYPFVSNPGQINTFFFGLIDLSKPNLILAILAGIAQFLQTKMLPVTVPPKEAGAAGKDEGAMATVNKQMTYFMPLITVFIGASLPGGLALYWLATTVLTIIQQFFFLKKTTGHKP